MRTIPSADVPPLDLAMTSERTLVLVKPDGVRRGLIGEVLGRIEQQGFHLLALDLTVPSRDLLEEHYAAHRGKAFFDDLVAFMSSGPVVSAVVTGRGCVDGVRAVAGATDPRKAAPGTIRHDHGTSVQENVMHAADSAAGAEQEMGLWFPGRPVAAGVGGVDVSR